MTYMPVAYAVRMCGSVMHGRTNGRTRTEKSLTFQVELAFVNAHEERQKDMQFEFTAKVEKLGYATVREVTDQAKTHLTEPDWEIWALQIGVWEQTRSGWQTKVTVTADDGSTIEGNLKEGLPAVWSQ